jgi:CRISPR-associated endonuclease/helicase Cas3
MADYHHYWGKAENDQLKVAYCSGKNEQDKNEILANAKFKEQIAKKLQLPTHQAIGLDELEKWANTVDKKQGKEKWQFAKKDYAAYHLLPYHCLDVAAVGYVLLEQHPFLANRFEQLFGISKTVLFPWLSLLLALHDCGKFAESFQQLKQELRKDWWGEITKTSYDIRHDSLGFVLWEDDDALRKHIAIDTLCYDTTLRIWLQAVTGHHGLPPRNSFAIAKSYFRDHDISSAAKFFTDTCSLFKLDLNTLNDYEQADEDWTERQQQATWLLAGFTILCDWLGSDTEHFKFCANESLSLEDYWQQYALPSAKLAVQKAGILPTHSAIKQNLQQLFSYLKNPTPLQIQADSLQLSQKPQLLILEDVTGAGKTEAAIMFAHRLIQQGSAQGVFIGLPTMATANAMYERVAECYLKFYADDKKPSLILAHSASKLSDKFQQSIIDLQSSDCAYATKDATASAQCVRWLSDHRKKALLADVGIGTIDQALLSVLPAKHQSLRLLGLANKVLIVDEVHAYDAYMNRLLQNLLEFHAFLGGSAILLSATLPFKMRQKFVQAFQRGAGYEACYLQKQGYKDYPLLTHISDIAPVEQVLETRPDVKRTVKVAFLHDYSDIIATIKAAVANKQCVCWIRNTVFDARTAYSELEKVDGLDNEQLLLFHSRYTLHDRKTVENNVLSLFGKNSTAASRQGKVLIATQVVEQSLDLDFDVMISDLAPIDLLIQRAGRLQRHIRDNAGNPINEAGQKDQRTPPTLIIHSPPLDQPPAQNWYKAVFPKANGVYPHTGQLWRTALLLGNKGEWQMPEDARELIETVYSDEDSDIPDALKKASNDAEGEHWSKISMANMNALKLEQGYTLSDNAWDEDARIPTRLSEDSVTIYLAVWQEGKLSPLVNAKKYAWDLSSVNINAKRIKALPELATEVTQALNQLIEQEKIFNEYSYILPLNALSTTQWQAVDINSKIVKVSYSIKQGLLLGDEIELFTGENTA